MTILGLYLSLFSLNRRMGISSTGHFKKVINRESIALSRGQAVVFKAHFTQQRLVEPWVKSQSLPSMGSGQWRQALGFPWILPWRHGVCFQGGPCVVGLRCQSRLKHLKPTIDKRLVKLSVEKCAELTRYLKLPILKFFLEVFKSSTPVLTSEAFAPFLHILYLDSFLVSSPSRTCSLKFLVNTQNLWMPSATAFSLSQMSTYDFLISQAFPLQSF